jgi:hypothetical protein
VPNSKRGKVALAEGAAFAGAAGAEDRFRAADMTGAYQDDRVLAIEEDLNAMELGGLFFSSESIRNNISIR